MEEDAVSISLCDLVGELVVYLLIEKDRSERKKMREFNTVFA